MRRLERRGIGRREQLLVALAMALNAGIVLAFVIVRRHVLLAGDAPEYNTEGKFIAAGHWFWSMAPYGIAHASAWKAPLYPAFLGVLYAILGSHYVRVEVVQALVLAPLTVLLSWWLARGVFGRRAGVATALIVAVYPNIWQWDGLLYSESIAIPLTLAALILCLERPATIRRAALAGALVGLNLLARPSSILLIAGVAVAWLASAGWRRGAGLAAVGVLVAVLVVAPWTVRNAVVLHGFLPISIQDAAGFGTFNSQAASDPVFPYAWRLSVPQAERILDPRRPLPDITMHAKLEHLITTYIKQHPASLVEAFFWNGLTRTWDVRRPSHILDEPHFEGRSRALSAVGMVMWWIILVLALSGLWRWRRRRSFVLPVLALALAASIVYTTESGTRYRATLEPLAVVVACSAMPLLVRPSPLTSAMIDQPVPLGGCGVGDAGISS